MMCRQVEEVIANKTDEVFMLMRRDYITVVNGTKVPQGHIMPKFERQMRSEIAKAIEKREKGEEDLKLVADKAAEDATTEKEVGVGEEDVKEEEVDEIMDRGNGTDEESQDPSKQLADEAARTSQDNPFAEGLASPAGKESADVPMSDRESSA